MSHLIRHFPRPLFAVLRAVERAGTMTEWEKSLQTEVGKSENLRPYLKLVSVGKKNYQVALRLGYGYEDGQLFVSANFVTVLRPASVFIAAVQF